jgi:hypothetical protein
LLDVLSVAEFLLHVNIASFFAARLLVFNPCLPCLDLGREHLLDLFQRLARGLIRLDKEGPIIFVGPYLGEAQEDVNEHGYVETSEDEICFPLDVDKCRRDEVAQRKVEDPVRSVRFMSDV